MSDRDFVAFWRGEFDAEGDLSPLPFGALFDELVEQAEREVVHDCPGGYRLLLESARTDIPRSLRRTLTDLCALPLQRRFALFRRARRSMERPPTDSGETTALYSEFVGSNRAETMADVLRVCPALGPLLETARRAWVDSTTELLLHLEQDRSALAGLVPRGQAPGRIAAVRMDLSDRHTHGRTVAQLDFEDGGCVVHKPRDMGLEHAYNRLLERLNREGLAPELRPLSVLERPGYGWVEGVEPEPCRNVEEVRLFYRRAGMLLALWWALGGTDCHLSNVFACGPHPVLIDAEMFFRSPVPDGDDADLDRMHFLPRREPDGEFDCDITGLGGIGSQPTAYRVPVWLHPRFGQGPVVLPAGVAQIS